MKFKKCAGFALIASTFVPLFLVLAKLHGFLATAIVFGGVIYIAAGTYFGVTLIMESENE